MSITDTLCGSRLACQSQASGARINTVASAGMITRSLRRVTPAQAQLVKLPS